MKRVVRETKETRIEIRIARADAAGAEVHVATGKPFFDHMLSTFARYAGLSLSLEARFDLTHHLMEDVALALGRAVREITPPTAARYGERTIPMDDALVAATIDVGGRAYFSGELPSRLYTHVFRSFADALGATLHLRVLAGQDRHHVIEAAFKATGLALRQAMEESGAVFSTKGSIAWTIEDDG
jgi:imidazoleglycerol-phosphate dehydratase